MILYRAMLAGKPLPCLPGLSAQFDIGVLHLVAWGLTKGEAQASQLLHSAAEQGVIDAEFSLGESPIPQSRILRSPVA